MKKQILTTALALTLGVSACAPNTQYSGGPASNETMGAIAGAAIGGLLGGQLGEGSGKTASAVIGALLGAWAGSHVAASMSQQDQVYYEKATTQAQSAPIGEPVQWYNPESGSNGVITATREGQTRSGDYCREYQQTVTIDGQTERAYGTACRQPDGSWKIVK